MFRTRRWWLRVVLCGGAFTTACAEAQPPRRRPPHGAPPVRESFSLGDTAHHGSDQDPRDRMPPECRRSDRDPPGEGTEQDPFGPAVSFYLVHDIALRHCRQRGAYVLEDYWRGARWMARISCNRGTTRGVVRYVDISAIARAGDRCVQSRAGEGGR